MWQWIVVAFLVGVFVSAIGAVLVGFLEEKNKDGRDDTKDKHDGLNG